MVLSHLFPHEVRGATVIAKTLEQVDGRRLGRHTLRMTLREPRKKRATYGKNGRARAQTTDDHTRDFTLGTSNAAAYFIYILDCM